MRCWETLVTADVDSDLSHHRQHYQLTSNHVSPPDSRAAAQHLVRQLAGRADVEHVHRAEQRLSRGLCKPRFGATNVSVCRARIVCKDGSPVSQSSPLGKSTAITGRPLALIASIA